MNQDLERKFFDRFVFLHPEYSETRSLMGAFGFACGDGWFQLLWDLCEEIDKIEKVRLEKLTPDEHARQLLEGEMSNFYVSQVKEKFGSLRFYAECSTEEIEKLIHEAENKSTNICEDCGELATLCSSGKWYKTVCVNHQKIKEGRVYKPVGKKNADTHF